MKRALATLALLLAATCEPPAAAQQPSPQTQQTCPLGTSQTDAAKSNTLFLYFPTAIDYTFFYQPPVQPFDASKLSPNSPLLTAGDTAALIDRIHAVVADDYCEFNVRVENTRTDPDHSANPSSLPPNYNTVAIGADTGSDPYWGMTPDTPPANHDHSRVWAAYYGVCEGGSYVNNVLGTTCPATNELTGNNGTVERWAQAIGGTAAHEAGHTYGLQHADEDPPGVKDEPGPPSLAGEDPYNHHLMPAGKYILAPDRVEYRRHFGDRTYGMLATQVGLTMQTMHNWDLQNPNKAIGHKLSIDFLSTETSPPTIDWSYTGAESPWKDPQVESLGSTTTFQNASYHNYRISWSTANPAYTGGTAGQIHGGGRFHVGATFTGVDFNQPNAIIVGEVTLYNTHGNPLVLHPRLPGYDTGAVDANGTFALNIYNPPGGVPLQLTSAHIYQLPRVASIESMIGGGLPYTFDGRPITPWDPGGSSCAPGSLADGRHCAFAPLYDHLDRPHVLVKRRLGDEGVVDCSDRVDLRRLRKLLPEGKLPVLQLPQPAEGPKDSSFGPDREGTVCAGTVRDPFPSATVYMIASFVDPQARHYDPRHRRYVTGPVTSRVYYQFAGVRHPELLWHHEPDADGPPDRDERHDREERRDRHE